MLDAAIESAPRPIQRPCIGCKYPLDQVKIVGIGDLPEADKRYALEIRPDGRMGAYPVCEACYRDPSHRKRVLKLHFFEGDYRVALARAGSSSIG